MDSTREHDEAPAEPMPAEPEQRQDTMPFPPPVQSLEGEVTFGQSPPMLDGEPNCGPCDPSAPEEAFGPPESLEIPESLRAQEAVDDRPESQPSPQLSSSVPETHQDPEAYQGFIDFSEILAELDAVHERNEPDVSSELPDPAAALRGRRWIEPKRVPLRASNPDSFRPTTRKIKSRSRAQSAAAVVLVCGVVVGGAFIGIRVAMSRMNPAAAGMVQLPRATPSTSTRALMTEAAPIASAVPEIAVAASNAPASSANMIAEPPSSANANTVLPPPKVAAPTPKHSARANIPRNSSTYSRHASAPSSNHQAVPVDQVYVNKSGELVDANGNPLRESKPKDPEPVLPASHDDPSEPAAGSVDEKNSSEQPSLPKNDEPPKSVDEAQPWR